MSRTQTDLEVDVVVIGFGAAGASAAITAHDAGAEVLILEKMPHGGGNSRVSAGQTFIAHPDEANIADLVDWLEALSQGTVGRDLLEVFARGTCDLPDWIAGLGGQLLPPETNPLAHTFPGTISGPNFPEIARSRDMFAKRCIKEPAELAPSARLWALLLRNVEQRGIAVRYGVRAGELAREPAGAVTGVTASIGDETIRVRARRGVVMTCGGYENDPALKTEYVPSKPMKFAGNPGNTGDGVRMAGAIGADLWHMTRTATFVGYQSDAFEAAFCLFFHGPGFIWVDRNGRRYIDETSVELHDFDRVFSVLDPDLIAFPRIPSFAIFDEETRRAGPLTWSFAGYNREAYAWSADNSAEIERGWIKRANTLAALAAATGLPEASLEATLTQYNQSCAAGKDQAFGRPGKTLKALEPPFYAIQLDPVALNTQGGARRDAAARVIDVWGKPIPGLYSAGEFGSIWGFAYPSAGNLTEAMVYGQIAGRNAAAPVGG